MEEQFIWILSLITSWLFPISIFVVIAGVVVDLLKKRFYWSKFALIFFVITVILLVIQIQLIYRITGDILNNSSNETVSTKTTPTANWKTYVSERLGYSIKIPPEYSFKEGDQNNYWEQFYLPKNDGSENDYWEKQVVVWDTNTSDIDPCNPNIDLNKLKDFMEMKCVSINDITFRAVNVKQKQSRSKNYVIVYVTIYKGKQYSISFTNVELSKREQIISTFKFIETTPSATCRPRPACLDAEPRCLIAETADMCPPSKPTSPKNPF